MDLLQVLLVFIIAHVIADYIAATLDPDIRPAALGIVIGGSDTH